LCSGQGNGIKGPVNAYLAPDGITYYSQCERLKYGLFWKNKPFHQKNRKKVKKFLVVKKFVVPL